MKDIFRPHASTTRCKGDSSSTDEVSSSSNDHHSRSSHRHSNIFRKKRLRGQGIISDQCIEEISSLVSFGGAWPPPPMMAVSSSTDTKSIASKCGGGSSRRKGGPLLDRSIPVQVDSADSRNAATPSPRLIHNHHPSYYKIEIDGTQCQLYAGDDNSVQITPEEHNRNIQATGGPRLRSIDRAVPLASTRSQSPLLMEEEEVIAETSHDHNWTVSDTGAIVKVPNKSVEVAVSPEQPPQSEQPSVVSFNYSPQKPSSSQYNNYYYSSLPILTKASSDSGSHASSKSSNELLPESPPHVNRSVYEKSLFEESFSRSTSSGKSRSTKAVSGGNEGRGRRSPIIRKVTFSEDMPTNSNKSRNVKKEEEEGDGMSNKPKRNNACRLDFMSQLWDFVNLTCGSVDCRV